VGTGIDVKIEESAVNVIIPEVDAEQYEVS
jgi:hypothetical protein